MAEKLALASTILYVLAAVLFLLAIFLWFRFEILKIIGDLSGRTARASIAKLRQTNEQTGKKALTPSPVNQARGTVTETASGLAGSSEETEELVAQTAYPETGLLQENKVIIESGDSLLPGTELLAENMATVSRTAAREKMNIREEIVLVHTDEVI